MQSTLDTDSLHVAVIMDGNGRWATRRGLPRSAGHREGAKALQRVIEAAPALGIRVLTVFAFSSDNWQRPRAEVQALLRLLQRRLRDEMHELRAQGIRLSVIGRRDRLPRDVVRLIEQAEALTADGSEGHLRVALDYSAREALATAAARLRDGEAASFADLVEAPNGVWAPPVDLLIRSGGEQRLSDFLLWECAYAELYFTPTLWPDFDGPALAAAVDDYRRRERRFGGLGAQETQHLTAAAS